jgi:site-specific recombinase XerD
MLEAFFTVAKVRTRMEQGPMSPYLIQRAAALHSQGYRSEVIRTHLRAAHRFGLWLVEHGHCVADITDATVDSYLRELRRRYPSFFSQTRHHVNALGLRQFVDFLAQQGALRSDRRKSLTRVERWLADFDHHLDQVVGNAPSTRSDYVRYARRLLTECFGAAEPDWSSFKAEQISDFLRRQAEKLKPSNCGDPVRALRAFIRFLVAKGAVPVGLDGAVVRVRAWSQSSLPRHISPVELQRVLNSVDLTTPLGLRERAIVMVLGQLGLRASELVKLSLDDIDWAEGRVIIRTPKNRRERILPLPQQVGNALVAYLQHARPSTPARELFVRWRAPLCALSGAMAVGKIVRKALKRAGVNVHRPGVQVLRHTLATQMVCRGATFKEAADILGHRCLSSTALYAKLDLVSLSRVAMPWPGGAQ